MHVQYMHEGQNCRIVQRRNTPSTRKPVGSGVDEGSIELLQRCYRHSSMCHAKDGAKSSTVTNRQIFWRTLEPSSSKGGAVTDYLVDIISVISTSNPASAGFFIGASLRRTLCAPHALCRPEGARRVNAWHISRRDRRTPVRPASAALDDLPSTPE